MPRIDDQTIPEKRPFKKKPYRPWNLFDDDLQVTNEKIDPPLEDKVTTKESISNHMGTNKETFNNQIVNATTLQVTNNEPTSSHLSNQISNQVSINEYKKNVVTYVEPNAVQLIHRVSGLQRKILFYIVEDCILRGVLFSNPIPTESLQKLTNADKDTLKTATQRLVNKKLIQRGYGKKGKGGFAVFHITEEIRNAVIEVQKQELSSQHLVTNWVSKKESMSIYSSGSNINTTTRETVNNNYDQISSSWETLDIEPLSKIGFTKAHLKQIILDDKLPIDVVQDSIYAFAFDLDKNNKEQSIKGSPINFFMAILRSGKPYAPPANYESPQDAAMRIYLERKKESEIKRQAMENELFQIAFNEWESSLNNEEKEKLYPPTVKVNGLRAEKVSHLRLHFKEHLWPTLKIKYLSVV